MKKILRKVEINSLNLSKEELSKQIKSTLKMFFEEIINIDPYFGPILKRIKESYNEVDEKDQLIQKLKEELRELRNSNLELNSNIKEIKEKMEKLTENNKSLTKNNNDLKVEIADIRSKLFDAKNKLAEAAENILSKDMLEEIEDLYNENQYMRKLNGSLNTKVKKLQLREEGLILLIQNDNKTVKEILDILDNRYTGMVEIGKGKLKIPILDLSKVNYDINSDESEEENDNIVHNKVIQSD